MEKIGKLMVLGFVLFLVFSALLYAGGGQEEAKDMSGASEGKSEYVVGLAFNTMENTLYFAGEEYLRRHFKRIGDENGVTITMKTVVAEGDPVKQKTQIEDLISGGADVILANAVDSKAILTSIMDAHDEGIPFVNLWREAAEDPEIQADAYSGQDTVAQAYVAMKGLAEMMIEDGVEDPKCLNVMGDLRDENAVNRNEGLEKAASEYDIELVSEVPTEWNPDKAKEGVTNALRANPDINCMFIASDFMMPAILSAMEANNRKIPYGEGGHIYTAACDLQIEGYRAMVDGYVDTQVIYDVYQTTENAADLCWTLMQGKKPNPSTILVPGQLATRENLDEIDGLWALEFADSNQ